MIPEDQVHNVLREDKSESQINILYSLNLSFFIYETIDPVCSQGNLRPDDVYFVI